MTPPVKEDNVTYAPTGFCPTQRSDDEIDNWCELTGRKYTVSIKGAHLVCACNFDVTTDFYDF